MAASRTFSNLKSILQLQLQRLACSFAKPRPTPKPAHNTMPSASVPKPAPEPAHNPMPPACVHVDTSNWKKLDSRSLGLSFSMIPDSSRIVLKILQNEGYDAYLVGGCVRDLLLNKVPKDFDVITSANLGEIKKKFHRAYIVGRKFPICRVHVRGSAIEVSSFETVASHSTEKEDFHLTDMPEGYDEKDFLRWRNSLQRDFTINSLFYDPFAQRIYDYSDGMTDLKAKELRTLVPARLSFEKDCARILRGIRIAARLGFSFAKDAEKAIHSLHPSITSLDKGRLMMELNYMLSYGAAEPSILLLKRLNVLELLLPFQAAYLAERSNSQNPVMLMKLLFNMDSLTSCDQPCNSGLWVSLLAFHLALANNPQDAIVVWAFSTFLYHGNWKGGVKAARELSAGHVHFTPEILKSTGDVTDEELSRQVTNFAAAVLDSTDMLTDSESLCTAMSRYPSSPSSGLVLISKNAGKEVSEIVNVLMKDIETLNEKRRCYSIDYSLLGKGDILETRFALGKIIMDTMRSGVIYGQTTLATEKGAGLRVCKSKVKKVQAENLTPSISKLEIPKGKDGTKRGRSVLVDQKHQQKTKKQKPKNETIDLEEQKCVKEKLEEILSCQEIAQKRQQLQKVVVKDVKKLLSFQEVTLKNVKVELEKDGEAQTSNDILGVLGKVPKMVSHHETQTPQKILNNVGKVSGIRKLRVAQGPEKAVSVLGKVPELKMQQKEQLPTDMVSVLSLSNIFQRDEFPSNKAHREEKQSTVGDRPQDKSVGVKKPRKLSTIFK